MTFAHRDLIHCQSFQMLDSSPHELGRQRPGVYFLCRVPAHTKVPNHIFHRRALHQLHDVATQHLGPSFLGEAHQEWFEPQGRTTATKKAMQVDRKKNPFLANRQGPKFPDEVPLLDNLTRTALGTTLLPWRLLNAEYKCSFSVFGLQIHVAPNSKSMVQYTPGHRIPSFFKRSQFRGILSDVPFPFTFLSNILWELGPHFGLTHNTKD